jgi:hypothetical protein
VAGAWQSSAEQMSYEVPVDRYDSQLADFFFFKYSNVTVSSYYWHVTLLSA